jgi:SAM-dependent methyltransferase
MMRQLVGIKARLRRVVHLRPPRLDPVEVALEQAYQNVFINDLKTLVEVRDKRVLVVGCNRGLECELFRRHGAREVTGIDPAPGIGEDFPRPYINYVNASAENMSFEDNSFDVVATFASLEHIPDPLVALKNIVRVTKRYGVMYCHGSLLWYSPFGHHMGEIFKDEPWIHIRKPSLKELVEHYGDVSRIVNGNSLRYHLEYVANSPEFNRLSVRQYKSVLVNLLESSSIVRVMFNMNMEHKKLLTPEIAKELEGYTEEDLLTDSVCFVLRKT